MNLTQQDPVFFSNVFRILSEFFAQCPKFLESFRTKYPKKFCLWHNNALVAAPCSLIQLKFCKFVFATKPLPLLRLMIFLQYAYLLKHSPLLARRNRFHVLPHSGIHPNVYSRTIVAIAISCTGFVI